MTTPQHVARRAGGTLFDLAGRVAIVTGGASGIGWQMAVGLAEMGADTVVCGRHADRCKEAAAELERLGVRALGLRCDVSDAGEVQLMVERTSAELGRIDVLVNNAGTSWGAPAEEHPLAGWAKVMAVNLTGAFLCSQAVARGMLDGPGGKIVNVASVAGLRGAPAAVRQAAAYSASKGGMLALTRDLACAWGPRGVNVNAIAPGWFPSGMSRDVLDGAADRIAASIPLGRLGGPHDLKGAVVFLSSRASDYITGQTLVVDGGRTAW
ncbi:MAG: glucose 1-dehydrogenase [Solirubrobacteraceae bacterium]